MAKKPVASGAAQKRRVQSIEVGFRVIRALQGGSAPLALRDIAKATGMPPSKVHLYLASFLREGLVAQDLESGHYALGDFAVELGLAAIRQLSVVDLSKQEMAALTAQTGCASYLSLYTERGPAIVSKVDGRRQGAFSVRLGYVLPFDSSATGLIFLAHMPGAEADAPLTEQAALAKRLAQVRAKGYATTAGLINANFAAVSAPLFDYSGDLAAALTLLGPDKYLVGDRLERSIEDVIASAARITARLGGKAHAKAS